MVVIYILNCIFALMKKHIKIAFIGTRGIFFDQEGIIGGFEKFVYKLALGLVKNNDFQITIYVPSYVKYDKNQYEGIRIKKVFHPEKMIGKLANFIYDFLSYKLALSEDFDIIYECGYGTFVPAVFLKKKGQKPYLVVNMDGWEWQRKQNFFYRKLLLTFEKIVSNKGDHIIADHKVIYNYLKEKYNTPCHYISYGTELPHSFDKSILKKYGLKEKQYFINVSRPVVDNNIEMIFTAFKEFNKKNNLKYKMVWVTNIKSRYAHKVMKKFHSPDLVYLYTSDEDILFSLRHFAIAYIHGHTVGGTNPSLLEAVASQVPIIAYKTNFTKNMTHVITLYFTDVKTLAACFFTSVKMVAFYKITMGGNLDISWKKIVDEYSYFFKSIANNCK